MSPASNASDMLPPFLPPLGDSDSISQNISFHRARFCHASSLRASQVLWWPPQIRETEPEVVLFFIPGNPGLVDFYIPFLSEVHASGLSPNLAVVAQAHLDQYPGIHNSSAGYRPEDALTIQIENSLELLAAIDKFYSKKPRIIVVGHSVGSWLSLQVMKALPADKIEAAFLLFPTISNIGNTPNGRALAPIFWPSLRPLLASLSFIARWLPTSVLSSVYSSWPQSQLRVLQEFLSSKTSIHSSLSMAAQEMKTIRELDVATLDKFQDKLYFYYAVNDSWVDKEREVVLQALNQSSMNVVHGPPGIPHAFCIKDSEVVAKQCCRWITTILTAIN